MNSRAVMGARVSRWNFVSEASLRASGDISTGTGHPGGSRFKYGPAAFEPGAERLCGQGTEGDARIGRRI